MIDQKMSKADLRKKADISPNTMTKLNKDEEVAMSILGKICRKNVKGVLYATEK